MGYKIIKDGIEIRCDSFSDLERLLQIVTKSKLKRRTKKRKFSTEIIEGTNQEKVHTFLTNHSKPISEAGIAKALKMPKTKVYYALHNLQNRTKTVHRIEGLWKLKDQHMINGLN